MIVDTSAFVAVLFGEPEARQFLDLMREADAVRTSAATLVETAIVVDSGQDARGSRRLDRLLKLLNVDVVPLSVEQAHAARAAYRDFGRGSGSQAQLNFGDCFSYALASVASEPLLFKGDDFVHTDLLAVVT